MSKEKFIKNYTGNFDPGKYYDYLQEVKENERRFKNATPFEKQNERMLKEANQNSYNKHLRR